MIPCTAVIFNLLVVLGNPQIGNQTGETTYTSSQSSNAQVISSAGSNKYPKLNNNGLQSHYSFNPDEDSNSLLELLFRTLFALAIVCLLAYFILNKIALRFGGLANLDTRSKNTRLLQVVERLTLEPRRSLFIVKTQDQYFLVGSSEQGLQLLSKLELDETPETLEKNANSSSMPFFKYLIKAQQKVTEDPSNASN